MDDLLVLRLCPLESLPDLQFFVLHLRLDLELHGLLLLFALFKEVLFDLLDDGCLLLKDLLDFQFGLFGKGDLLGDIGHVLFFLNELSLELSHLFFEYNLSLV